MHRYPIVFPQCRAVGLPRLGLFILLATGSFDSALPGTNLRPAERALLKLQIFSPSDGQFVKALERPTFLSISSVHFAHMTERRDETVCVGQCSTRALLDVSGPSQT